MAKEKDTFRMLATPYSEVKLREMKARKEPYPLNLLTLRALPLKERAQTLARIKADIPLIIKHKIPLIISGAQAYELPALKHVLGYP